MNLFSSEFDQSDQLIPKLLVSLRSANEVPEALEGGADIIDIKEPSNGPLGAASIETIQTIAVKVHEASPKTPVTVAFGELADWQSKSSTLTDQLAYLAKIPSIVAIKFGLARMKKHDWQNDLATLKDVIDAETLKSIQLVPAAYADDNAADSPSPEQVFSVSNRLGLRGFLIDTFSKNPIPKADSRVDLSHQKLSRVGQPATKAQEPSQKPSQEPTSEGLLASMSSARLAELFEVIRIMEITGALAGSLTLEQIEAVMPYRPAIIGVRTAACEGGRNGTVSREKVKSLRECIHALATTSK